MLHQNYWIPPGEIGVWPFFSISTGEADDRLYTIAAILDTLGIPHSDSSDRRGHYVKLLDRPLAFRVLAASFRTGVGFLGAGAILRSGERVTGLTTAAGIWVTAAIGVLVGSGFWVIGVGATLIALLIVNLTALASMRASGD